MLISIKRVYIKSGLVKEILLNFRYVKRVEEPDDPDKPRTRIIVEGHWEEGDDIIYTNEFIDSIKGKLTKARNEYSNSRRNGRSSKARVTRKGRGKGTEASRGSNDPS